MQKWCHEAFVSLYLWSPHSIFVAELSLNSTQFQFQFRLRLAFSLPWSSHPATHPPTQPPNRNRRYNSSQIKWWFWNTKILLSEYFKNTLRLLPNFVNTKNYFNATLRLIKDSFRNISRQHSSQIQWYFWNTKTSLSAYFKTTSRLQDCFTTSSKIPTILRLIKDFFRSTSRQHWRC